MARMVSTAPPVGPGRTAAVCKKGHVVSRDVIDPPKRLVSHGRGGGSAVQGWFYGECGASVVTTCKCGTAVPNPDIRRKQNDPNAFCIGCGEPFPWASREQLIGKLYGLLDFEEGLSPADRLEVVEAIAVLSEPEDPRTVPMRARAAAKIRQLAPGAWKMAQPILTSVLSDEVQQALQRLH